MEFKEFLRHYKNCVEFADSRSKIVLKDKKGRSKFTANNDNRKKVIAIRVDGCLIIDGEKCDFLLIVCNDAECQSRDVYFIELKGSDILKAISQINTSIEVLSDKLIDCSSISGRIILTRYNAPNLRNNTDYKRLKDKLKGLNGSLDFKEYGTEQI